LYQSVSSLFFFFKNLTLLNAVIFNSCFTESFKTITCHLTKFKKNLQSVLHLEAVSIMWQASARQ